MEFVGRHTTAVYRGPAGTIPTVPEGETADRVQIMVDGIQFVWRRKPDGGYQRYAGPIGWLTAEDFIAELTSELQEAQANG